MDADMSIDMTIRLVLVGTLAHTAYKQPNTPVAADEAQGGKYPQS